MWTRTLTVAAALLTVSGCGGAADGARAVGDDATPRQHTVSLSLFHCGIHPLTLDGRVWEADRSDLLLDATNAPGSWIGTGSAVVDGDRLTYRDSGGQVVPFVPEDGVPPPACL